MQIAQPKKHSFYTKCLLVLKRLSSIFDDNHLCQYCVTDTSMHISKIKDDTQVRDIIDQTVQDVFGCKAEKSKKHYKINEIQSDIYLRFKRKLKL